MLISPSLCEIVSLFPYFLTKREETTPKEIMSKLIKVKFYFLQDKTHLYFIIFSSQTDRVFTSRGISIYLLQI